MEPPVAKVVNRYGQSIIVLISEHASNQLPVVFGGLGLTEADKFSHAAWDGGSSGLPKQSSEQLDAMLILNTGSRLIYDCNRAHITPDAMPSQSRRFSVPENRDLSPTKISQRIQTVYEMFNASVKAAIDSARNEAIFVKLHNFTGAYTRQKRATEIRHIHHRDDHSAKSVFDISKQYARTPFALNQPYSKRDGVTNALECHSKHNALMQVMIGVRNDLIKTVKEQSDLAISLAKILSPSLQGLGCSIQLQEQS